MATAPLGSSQLQIDELNRYVLNPPQRAHSLLTAEIEKLAAEVGQFEAFRETVRTFDAVQPASLEWRTLQDPPPNSVPSDILAAYVDTVLTLDHYEEYDESLWDNICAEFGTDVATLLDADSPTQFTPAMRALLLRSIDQSIEDRSRLSDQIETERSAIDTCHLELVELVEVINGATVPAWYREQHERAIDEFLADRQQQLHDSPAVFDRQEYYEYLFRDEPWTYPILLGGTRLQEVSVVEQ